MRLSRNTWGFFILELGFVAKTGDRLSKEIAQLKRLEEKRAKVDALLKRKQADIAEQARKRKNKLFYQIGLLADLAGIAEESPGYLVGGFLSLADTRGNKDAYERLKKKGDELLAERDKKRKVK